MFRFNDQTFQLFSNMFKGRISWRKHEIFCVSASLQRNMYIHTFICKISVSKTLNYQMPFPYHCASIYVCNAMFCAVWVMRPVIYFWKQRHLIMSQKHSRHLAFWNFRNDQIYSRQCRSKDTEMLWLMQVTLRIWCNLCWKLLTHKKCLYHRNKMYKK